MKGQELVKPTEPESKTLSVRLDKEALDLVTAAKAKSPWSPAQDILLDAIKKGLREAK
jgi:hypothetical protein